MTAQPKPLHTAFRTTAFASAAATMGAFLVAAVLLIGFVFRETNALLTAQVLETLQAEAAMLRQEAHSTTPEAFNERVAARSYPGGSGLYALTSEDGSHRAGNLDEFPAELEGKAAGGVFHYKSVLFDQERLGAALVLSVPGGRLLVGRDIEQQRAFASNVQRLSLISFAVLAVGALVAALVASRYVLRRIEAITAASRSIMAGDLSQRVAVSGSGDELDELARNLNAMLERIEALMHGLQEVSDNIAHDLKTPLNRLRNRAEAALRDSRGPEAYREGLEATIEQADELIKTFNALLLIARLEAGALSDTAEHFALGTLVRDVAELYEPVAEEHGLSLVIDAAAGPDIRANRQLVGQAVANLIDNAIKYATPPSLLRPNTEPSISVSVASAGSSAQIVVGDRGPGIAPGNRDRVLRRFVRLEESRTQPGTGLGLSLVAAVARLHGGALRLEDHAPGLRVVLELPLAPEAA